MKRLAKWIVLPAVTALAIAFATPTTARAHGPVVYVRGYYPPPVVAPWRYPAVRVAPVYRYYPRPVFARTVLPVRRVYVPTYTYWVYP